MNPKQSRLNRLDNPASSKILSGELFTNLLNAAAHRATNWRIGVNPSGKKFNATPTNCICSAAAKNLGMNLRIGYKPNATSRRKKPTR